MRLVRPSWLEHRDENRVFEVYSLDVSHDGRRLVTGGLDSKVKIWDADSVAHPEAIETRPKLRATIAAHTGAVTAVKFSPDGRFVASGSDDRIVLVSELDPTRPPRQREFGSTGPDLEEVEVWTPRKRLVGHDNDVQDLAWSPDGQLLVSVGLDSAIIVWSGTTFEKIKRLDWHQSHVKGVAFDPANKFFVTCADDRTARIIRYSRASPTELSFSVEAVVSLPFAESPLTSYFRRCSWSPDGETIVCPNATNGPVPTVAVIERGQWATQAQRQVSLVGHAGPTEVARFSPRQYAWSGAAGGSTSDSAASNKGGSSGEACIVATGGEDGKIAVWSTENPRPLVIVENVASKLITDLAWSRSGTRLFASSLDGTVVMLEFGTTPGDTQNDGLGAVVSLDATLERLAKFGNATDLMDIPQSVEQVGVEQAASKAGKANKTNASAARSGAAAKNNVNPKPEAQGALGEANTAVKAEAMPAAPSAVPASLAKATPTFQPAQTLQARPVLKPVQVQPTRQKTSVTRDGRKRVTPMLLTGQDTAQPLSSMAPRAPMAGRPALSSLSAPGIWDRPSSALPPGGIATLVIGNKRKADDEPVPPRRVKEDTTYLRPVALNPATTVSPLRLATPRVVSHLSSDVAGSAVLEARNASVAGEPTRVTLVDGGQSVWTDFIPEYASLVAGAATTFWAVGAETGAVYLYTPQGTRLRAPIVLGAPLAMLETTAFYLVALTATGMLHAWDLRDGGVKALFPAVSIGPCLDIGQRFQENGLVKGPQVTQVWATEEGEVLVALSSGAVCHWDKDVQAWTRVSESFWAYGSQFWGASSGSAGDDGASTGGSNAFGSAFGAASPSTGAVAAAELLTNEESLVKAGARGRQLQRQAANRTVQAGFQGFEQSVSLAHLANRVAAARALHSPELPHFVQQFVRRLAERGERLKLAELFRELGGTPLLRLALNTAAEFRGVQELVSEYDDERM